MTTLLVIFCFLFAVLFLASDLKDMLRDAGGPVGALPAQEGRHQLCLTCGKQTDGAYYCGEGCYPPATN